MLHASTYALLLLSLGACDVLSPGGESDNSLIGAWQVSVPGDYESSVRFDDDGTFQAVVAEFGAERCIRESGPWSAEGGILSATVTEIDGAPALEHEEIPFELSGDQLTLNYVGDDPETFRRLDELPACGDYGWPSVLFAAEVDGVAIDFSTHFGLQLAQGQTLGQAAASGFLSFSGRNGGGEEPALCVSCQELTVEIFAVSPITAGTTYTMDYGGTGVGARGTHWPDLMASTTYSTDNKIDRPWLGTVTVTELGEYHMTGTFEFIAFDGVSTAQPQPSVTVTNGSFSIRYD